MYTSEFSRSSSCAISSLRMVLPSSACTRRDFLSIWVSMFKKRLALPSIKFSVKSTGFSVSTCCLPVIKSFKTGLPFKHTVTTHLELYMTAKGRVEYTSPLSPSSITGQSSMNIKLPSSISARARSWSSSAEASMSSDMPERAATSSISSSVGLIMSIQHSGRN